MRLMDNVIDLHDDLKEKKYSHGGYHAFNISDPKPRNIHKASVRDRLLHHAIYRKLYPFFDKKFIFDSYSCRLGKGTHRAVARFTDFARKVSKNHSRTCWVLIRYADDFVILNEDKYYLLELVSKIGEFLFEELKLELHPKKLFLKTIASGVDFLGWVNFREHRVLRTVTKRRMMRRVQENPKEETVAAYLGMLKHGNGHKLVEKITCFVEK